VKIIKGSSQNSALLTETYQLLKVCTRPLYKTPQSCSKHNNCSSFSSCTHVSPLLSPFHRYFNGIFYLVLILNSLFYFSLALWHRKAHISVSTCGETMLICFPSRCEATHLCLIFALQSHSSLRLTTFLCIINAHTFERVKFLLPDTTLNGAEVSSCFPETARYLKIVFNYFYFELYFFSS